jgi:hypothetical protein
MSQHGFRLFIFILSFVKFTKFVSSFCQKISKFYQKFNFLVHAGMDHARSPNGRFAQYEIRRVMQSDSGRSTPSAFLHAPFIRREFVLEAQYIRF